MVLGEKVNIIVNISRGILNVCWTLSVALTIADYASLRLWQSKSFHGNTRNTCLFLTAVASLVNLFVQENKDFRILSTVFIDKIPN